MAHEVLKSYKFTWYPHHRQIIITTKTFGCNRFVWNERLAICITTETSTQH
jgi:hypothetical protein